VNYTVQCIVPGKIVSEGIRPDGINAILPLKATTLYNLKSYSTKVILG